MILIDAHGTTHGLKIEMYERTIQVTNWRMLCEPDENGDWCPGLEHFECSLASALKWAAEEGCTHPSMASRVKGGALRAMSMEGYDDVDWLDESAEPADYFDENLDARDSAA